MEYTNAEDSDFKIEGASFLKCMTEEEKEAAMLRMQGALRPEFGYPFDEEENDES